MRNASRVSKWAKSGSIYTSMASYTFFLSTEACHIADDTTPFACDLDLGIVIQNLGSNVASALMWFDTNYEIQPEYVASLCQQFRQNCFG